MANFFDQFDVPTPPSPPRPPAPPQRPEGANFFDQFDAQPVAPAVAPVIEPESVSDEIDWQEMMSRSVRQGVSAVPYFTGLAPFTDPVIEAAFGSPTREASEVDEWGEPSAVMPVQFQENTGAVRFAVPQMGNDLMDAIMAPGKALRGEMSDLEIDPITGEIAPFSQDMIEGAALTAGLATGGRTPTIAKETWHLPSGPRVPKPVTRALEADGIPLSDVSARVSEIGPDAMVADIGENIRNTTAAVAGTPGPGQTIVSKALKDRKVGAPDRLTAELNDILGEAPVPSYVQSEIKTNMRNVGPEYDRLLATAPDANPDDVAALASAFDDIIANEKGSARTAAQTVRSFLNVNGTDQLDLSAKGLFATRKAINDMLNVQPGGYEAGFLKEARDKITDLIEATAPGLKEIDARYSELGEQSRAVDKGQTALGSERGDVRPQELADYVGENAVPAGTVHGPSGVPFRLSQGARAEIDRLVGTKLNDRVALNQMLKGESDWNHDRLVTLFGQEKTDSLYQLLDRERLMAETENLALSGSKTSAMQSAKEDIAGKTGPGPVRSALNFQAGDAVDSVLNKWSGSRREAQNKLIAEAVTGPGQWLRKRMEAGGGLAPVGAGAITLAPEEGAPENYSGDTELMRYLAANM